MKGLLNGSISSLLRDSQCLGAGKDASELLVLIVFEPYNTFDEAYDDRLDSSILTFKKPLSVLIFDFAL